MSIENLLEKLIEALKENTVALKSLGTGIPKVEISQKMPGEKSEKQSETKEPDGGAQSEKPRKLKKEKLPDEISQIKPTSGNQEHLIDQMKRHTEATFAQALSRASLVRTKEDRKALVKHFKPDANKLSELGDLGPDIWTRVIEYVDNLPKDAVA